MSQADLTLTESEDVNRIILQGRLDSAGVAAVEIKFNAGAVASGKPAIVDLSGVTFIASLGIRMLITASKRMAQAGRPLVLLSPQELVDESLKAIDLYRLIPVAFSEREALDQIAGA